METVTTLFWGAGGLVALITIAIALSEDKRLIPWRLIAAGVGLQVVLALLFFKLDFMTAALGGFARGVNKVLGFSQDGIEFVFGPAASTAGGPLGFVFAVQVLPLVIFFSALIAVLYHLGVMQWVIRGLAAILKRALNVTGIEAMVMATNVFVGQAEAPLAVRPYLSKMTRSQIMTLMTGGFATIAGTVLIAYVGFIGGAEDAARIEALKNLLLASLLSAPAAFVLAKIMVPEGAQAFDVDIAGADLYEPSRNIFDAAAQGATDGLKLAANIAAMLIAYVSLLALVNWPIGAATEALFGTAWYLQDALGAVLQPLAFALGVPWEDANLVGGLIGQKIILTEFVAYAEFGALIHGDATALSPKSIVIATFALCGFANFASIAVQTGALTIIAPDRRADVVALGFKAMIAGALASMMTAAIAGALFTA